MLAKRFFVVFMLLFVLTFLALSGTSSAQSTIQYGQTINIDQGYATNVSTNIFTGIGGDQVTIRVWAQNTNSVPKIDLLYYGQTVASASGTFDPSYQNTDDDVELTVMVPMNGNYQIRVTNLSPGSGQFGLTLKLNYRQPTATPYATATRVMPTAWVTATPHPTATPTPHT